MKIVGSIQARLGSTRLPGKVLRKINGKPMLQYQVERIKKSLLIDDLVIATTTNNSDDPIVEFCIANNLSYYRGSEDDVLDRISNLLLKYNADVHVEFFGDSPLTDPELVDQYIGYFLKNQDEYDFISNHQKTSFPPGQEILVYKAEALINSNSFVPKNDPLREHVSIHITKYPEKYRLHNLEAPSYYNYPELFLEVDTPADFEVISKIISHFEDKNCKHFNLLQIIDFMSVNTSLAQINKNEERRWKAFRDE